MKTDLTCQSCNGHAVEVLLPGFCALVNGELEHLSVDDGAEPLTFFCRTCDADVSVTGYDAGDASRVTYGRWS